MAKKSTKRALLLSTLSLLMCVSMLIGSTYAWFTDSVTSAGNIIKSGTLEVTMEWKDASASGAQQAWKDASEGAIFDYDRWEPGYVEAKNIKIGNAGTLALKYQLHILATGMVSELADVIDVYYAEGEYILDREMSELAYIGTLSAVLDRLSDTASGDLIAGESDVVTLALKMQETAGNQYQDLSIGSAFAIQLVATQLTSEFDSFDNQYDKMATIDTIDELNEALAADYDLIQLGANLDVTDTIAIPAGKTVAIDLAGFAMSQAKGDIAAAYAMIDNQGNLTILDSVGNGKISFADTTPYTADIGWASNTIRNVGVLTINGGTVENTTAAAIMNFSYPHAIDCYQGSVTVINGGTVKSANYDAIRMFCNSTTLATTVEINGGNIVNRVSFQNPNNNTHSAGYGVLNINGGNFTTTDGVKGNVRLLNFSRDFSNMKATVTGGTFDKGFYTQDLANSGVVTSDWLTYAGGIAVSSAAELQDALDNAANGDVIKFASNITGNVTAVAKAGVAVTIDGNGNILNGTITVDGQSAGFTDAPITIKNIKFIADTVPTDACVNMGVNGNNNTRYIYNLTVENCYFDVPGKVAVKSYSNGDNNLKVIGCTAAAGMHSLVQVNNVAGGLLVQDCKFYSKNGINVNQSERVSIIGCEADVLGYAVRFGASSGGEGVAETYLIKDCQLSSACEESGDATVIIRGTADNATLTIENTTIVGERDLINNASNVTVIR